MKKYMILFLNVVLGGCYTNYPAGYQDVYYDDGGTVIYTQPSTSATYVTPTYVVDEPQVNVVYTYPQVTYFSAQPEIVYYDSPFFRAPHRPVRYAPHFRAKPPLKQINHRPSHHGGSIKPHAERLHHDLHIKRPSGNPVRNPSHKPLRRG